MSRALLVLANQTIRDKAIAWIKAAPDFSRIEFKAPKRTIPQNDRMWAQLTDVSTQATYHGMKLSPDDWKLIFMDGLTKELRIVPNLDSSGFVNLGRSTSKLSKAEMSDLMELISAYGAKNNIVFTDHRQVDNLDG